MEIRPQERNAGYMLFNLDTFSKYKFCVEFNTIARQIRADELGTIDKRVIHMEPRMGRYRGTNLHAAVIGGNLEKAFCIVEIHRRYHGDIAFDINLRDTRGKTVLDYAKENNRQSLSKFLLIAYLEENHAKPSIHFNLNRGLN